MQTCPSRPRVAASVLSAALAFLTVAGSVSAGTSTWVGAGDNDFWLNPANWNTPPAAGDFLVFQGNNRLSNSNNISAGTVFSGIVFNAPAGGFTLQGNAITLNGNVTNNQPSTAQTISLPVTLSATPVISVVSAGSLTLSGIISGGFGLTKNDAGSLTLGGANTFTGPVTINGGTVNVMADGNLGTAPVSAAAGRIILNSGVLRSTASFTINSNRGIAVGPASGSGNGEINVVQSSRINLGNYTTGGYTGATTLTYGGIIANNAAGVGGLLKRGFGGLVLAGNNTYTGPTIVQVGTLRLDFTAPTAPVNNIIRSNSSLTLGGENAVFTFPGSAGAQSFAALVVTGKDSATNNQAFSSTTNQIGHSYVRLNNGVGGSVNLNLGALRHVAGGGLTFILPTNGFVRTSSSNDNGTLGADQGIIGGWATVATNTAPFQNSTMIRGHELAAVDTNGNIVPFSGYTVYTAADGAASTPLSNPSFSNKNIMIGGGAPSSRAPIAMWVAPWDAGVTVDVNTISTVGANAAGDKIFIGTNNTLRLGRFGAIFRQDLTTAFNTYVGGLTNTIETGSGTAGSQDVGTLTAGGPTDNTPGEIVLHVNHSSQTTGRMIVTARIADNGTGPVTVIKTGPAGLKVDGHNTYSGGTYVIQGLIQLTGTEVGTANPNGFGSGPVYVFNGGRVTLASGENPNNYFIAGVGTDQENFGALISQNNAIHSQTITLIGDARIGRTSGAIPGLFLNGQITDGGAGFSLNFGDSGSDACAVNLSNVTANANDWTGNTIIGRGILRLQADEQVPDGLGKGSVFLNSDGTAGNHSFFDLNGRVETINGLSTLGNAANHNMFVQNSNANPATLVVGNNNQSSTYRGIIRNGLGTLSLKKIGGGTLTLTGTNTYTGNTTISNGVLALGNTGTLAGSAAITAYSGGTLDISAQPAFATPNTVSLEGGILAGNTSAAGIGTLNITNGQLTITVHPSTTNIVAGTLNLDGGANPVNITAVLGASTYPTQFVVLKYTTLNGSGFFSFGSVPSLSTQGYFTNDTTINAIVLVLTNGPKSLVWKGNDVTNPTFWDVNATFNWLASSGASPFNSADTANFDDTASTTLVDVRQPVVPAAVNINSTANYTFIGSGNIGGFGALTKLGSGTATFATAGDAYRGGVNVGGGTVVFASDNSILGGTVISNGATVQVGTNGGTGSLPGGPVVLDGSLVFNRGADFTVASVISGAATGSILKTNAGVLALNAANSFAGPVTVASGTLRTGNGTALGTSAAGTTVDNGATLDVNGQNLGAEAVTVAGDGEAGAGAIVNSGADQINALRNVVLSAATSFGGSSRWDIRESAAGLADGTLSGAFTLTKTGLNQVSLVGVNASTIGDVVVRQGTFGVHGGTTINPSSSVTVSNGATLDFNNNTVVFDPTLNLYGNGATPSVTLSAGSVIVSDSVTLNGPTLFAGNGNLLRVNGSVNGTGDLIKSGTSRLTFTSGLGYAGSTTISNGTVIMDGGKSGGTGITVQQGGALGGGGSSIGEALTVNGGGITPGNPDGAAQQTLTIASSVTLNNSTNLFELSPNPFSNNDQLVVFSDLTLSGVNRFRISVTDHLTVGDVYTLVTYFGSGNNVNTNTVQIVPPTFGYEIALVDPTTTPNEIRIQVLVAIGFDIWLGNDPVNPTRWDNGATTNWLKAGVNSVFTNGDFAHFSDFVPGFVGSSTNITLFEQITTAGVIFSNSTAAPFSFVGPGGLSGGGLVLEGEGLVTLANSGTNLFTGGALIDFNAAIFFNAATLVVGDGGANGNLGSGIVTNRGRLIFNRSGSLEVSNVIIGAGGVTNVGTGAVTLSGASTFTGSLEVQNGTVRAGHALALGSTNASFILTNAALDVNGQNLSNEWVYVSGSGPTGEGAIVNSGPSATSALLNVVLTGDTTFGGADETNRWDIRAEGGLPGQLLTYPAGSAFNITKKGNNQVALVGVTNIEPLLGNIDIQGGSLAIQTTTTQVGDPAGTITVRSNAFLNVWALTEGPVNKNIVLQDGGGYWSDSGTTTNIGAVTLSGGSAVLLNDGGTTLRLDNNVTGAGGITKVGGGTTILNGTVSYTGNTVISNGTLTLIGTTSLGTSPVISLVDETNTAPVLNVTTRTDGTLTIASGRTLRGSGTIQGALTVNSGGTFIGGQVGAAGVLTVTNGTGVTLGGSTFLKLDAVNVTSDRIQSTNAGSSSITYGGALVVTNLGGTLAAGQTYQLFRASSYGGSFSSITLPALSGTKYWTNNLSVDGTITVVDTTPPPAPYLTIEIHGGDVVLRSSSFTNLPPGLPVVILTSTNLLTPLSNWTVLSTNGTGVGGYFDYTNGPASDALRFYMLMPQ